MAPFPFVHQWLLPRLSTLLGTPCSRHLFGPRLSGLNPIAGDNKIKKAAQGVVGKAVAVPNPPAKRAALTTKLNPVKVIEISPDTKEVKQEKLVPHNEIFAEVYVFFEASNCYGAHGESRDTSTSN